MGFTEIAKVLLEKGANIEATDDSGNTALIKVKLFFYLKYNYSSIFSFGERLY